MRESAVTIIFALLGTSCVVTAIDSREFENPFGFSLSDNYWSRGFGDDPYREIGCKAGLFENFTEYAARHNLMTTGDFLGPMRRFEGDRISIGYFDFGNKESSSAIMMLVGLGSLMRSWQPALLQFLAAYSRVIIFDYPGQGNYSYIYNSTENPLPEYSIDFMAKSSFALLQHLGLDNQQTTLIGRSMGSIVALQMGVLYGDRLDKIITVSVPYNNTDPEGGQLWLDAKTNLDKIKLYFPMNKSCKVTQWVCYRYEARDLMRGRMAWNANSNTTSAQRNALDAFIDSGQEKNFKLIKNEILTVFGEDDTTTPLYNLINLSNDMPNLTRWVIIRNAGHTVIEQNVELMALRIIAFMENVGSLQDLNGKFDRLADIAIEGSSSMDLSRSMKRGLWLDTLP